MGLVIRRVALGLLGISACAALMIGCLWIHWVLSTIPDREWISSLRAFDGIPYLTQSVSCWITLDCRLVDCSVLVPEKGAEISDEGVRELCGRGAPAEWFLPLAAGRARVWREFAIDREVFSCFGSQMDAAGYVYCTAFSFGAL